VRRLFVTKNKNPKQAAGGRKRMKVSWNDNPVLLGLLPASSPSQDAFEYIPFNDLNEYLEEAEASHLTLSQRQIQLLEGASRNPIEYVISSSTAEDVKLLISTIVQFLPLVGVIIVHKRQRQPTMLKLPTKKVAHFLVPRRQSKDFHHAAYLAELIMLAQDYDPIGLLLHWCVFTLHHILRYAVDQNVNLIQAAVLDNTTNTNHNVGLLLMNAVRHCPTYDTYLATMLAFLATQIVLLSTKSIKSSPLLLDELIGWLCDGLSKASSVANTPPSTTSTALHCILPTLVTLLSENKLSRIVFIQHGGIGYLSKHLRGTNNTSTSPSNNHPSGSSNTPNPFRLPSLTTTSSYTKDFILAPKESKHIVPVQPMQMNRIDTRQQQIIRRDIKTSKQPPYSKLELSSQTKEDEEEETGGKKCGTSAFLSSSNSIPISDSSLSSSFSTVVPTFSIPSGSTTTISGVSQQMYYLTFCLWTLTFELFQFHENDELATTNNMVYQRFLSDGAISVLCHLVQSVPREKILRLSMASLYNLATATSTSTSVVKEMVACGLPKSLEHLILQQKRSEREDEQQEQFHRQTQAIYRILVHYMNVLSSHWSVYQMQLESGTMTWDSGYHSESFFQNNYKMFELNDFYALKLLISYVSTEKYLEQQEDLVAMACFDIGEFARFYPMGRSIVRRLGATDSIMKLMYHESDVVRHYALRCVSKLLVRHNCEL
jgi:hypothetical protein